MPKTSHKKNRPFDFKLINLVEIHPVLYHRQMGLSTYEAMKRKNEAWQMIAQEMNSSVDFCIMRWSNLRGQFQKELRNCRELCPKLGVIRGSTWPYLERMRFVENTVQFNKAKPAREIKNKVKKDEFICIDDSASENESVVEEEEHLKSAIFTYDDENDDYSLIEEVTEEYADSETLQQLSLTNLQKMATFLEGIEGENRKRVERRIMAFICKCQLRALTNEGIDDLYI